MPKMTTIRSPSIFTSTGSDAAATQEKVQLGLIPIVGGPGSEALDVTDRKARILLNRQARIVVCEANNKPLPGKKLRVASLFTCTPADNSTLCQRELFLNTGLIAIGNDPTAQDVAGFTNTNTNTNT